MLLIGDVHIISRYADRIIQNIRDFIFSHPDEQDIVFLGDFVYHFSYDRAGMLKVFQLFIDIFQSGKTLYILAGNHDWISDSFIFEEARQAFDILNQTSKNKIYFITNPQIIEIQGIKVLFLPYNVNIQLPDDLVSNDSFVALSQSKNKNEQLSYAANTVLQDYLTANPKGVVFHHYYIEGIQFPGERARFSYKDAALSKVFLEQYPETVFISGHLHKSFVYNNYLCTGTVWNTSPLEYNDYKFLLQIDINQKQGNAVNQIINPYVLMEAPADKPLDKEGLEQYMKKSYDANIQNFKSEKIKIQAPGFQMPKLGDITLFLIVEEADYDKIYDMIDQDLLNSLKDVKLKRKAVQMENAQDMLDISSKDLQQNISDRRDLLKEYIKGKYTDNADIYLQKLKELKIL